MQNFENAISMNNFYISINSQVLYVYILEFVIVAPVCHLLRLLL